MAKFPTTVLRAFFRDTRLTRLEYESLGDDYRRPVKESDLVLEQGGDDLRRLA